MAEGSNGDQVIEMEPIDEVKKKHIEEVLEPDLDTAIVRLAKARKEQPTRCVWQARTTANNNISYYGKVCVQPEAVDPQSYQLSRDVIKNICQISDADDFSVNLDSFSKIIVKCLEEQKELAALSTHYFQGAESEQYRKRNITSSHFASIDFIVDESIAF